ncbi:MAG TPA: YraN family protein [Candidatus Obscuribacterales bacterium]
MEFSADRTPAMPKQIPDIGELGEHLVAQWLQAQGWEILHRRWYCRWGELDIIARQSPIDSLQAPLVFVEVKTRSQGNWDADGLLSITPKKQAKLLQAAQMYLAQHPDKAKLPCRFDVALVRCQRLSKSLPAEVNVVAGQTNTLGIDYAIALSGYHLILQDYIQSAFD